LIVFGFFFFLYLEDISPVSPGKNGCPQKSAVTLIVSSFVPELLR
jgi:hypothetical protein